jgi:hypothetical protein
MKLKGPLLWGTPSGINLRVAPPLPKPMVRQKVLYIGILLKVDTI